jgi:hypothetical protein
MSVIEIIYIIIIARISDLMYGMFKDAYRSYVHDPHDIMRSIETSYAIKENIESLPDVGRVMLFTVNTDNDYFTGPIKISSVWGSYDNVRNWRDEIMVDKEYVRILKELIKEGSYIFETEKEPRSLLKSIYEKEGVKRSEKFFIKYKYEHNTMLKYVFRKKRKKAGFYYIAIVNTTATPFNPSSEVLIRESIEKLKEILSYEE